MEPEEDLRTKVDLLRDDVHRLLEHRTTNKGGDQEERRLLFRLLSQLESLEKEAHATCSMKCICDPNYCQAAQKACISNLDIVRELKSIKRQNFISHCLLALMIIVTGAWQLSEVSLLLAVKHKLCNPLKAVGDLLMNSVNGRGKKKLEVEGAILPSINGVIQIPGIDLSTLPFNGNER